jgi:uncharacterized protein YgbK (DUF1537 family)
LAYYADDFTGSTDALEALTLGGVETALFVEPPTAETLRRYPHIRAIGIAGNSRAMSPTQMDATLPGVFHSLRECRPSIVHYKTCSTFDSSSGIGSIGRAIDIGQQMFANRYVPLVVGVPQLQRFCVFGNLFARSGLDSAVYRLDRHPTMRNHPVTPMTEADLRLHLGQQTTRQIKLLDVLTLENGYKASCEKLCQFTEDPDGVVLFDTLTNEHLGLIGRLIWESQSLEQKPLFTVGSSGIEYALTPHWQAAGPVTNTSRLATGNVEPANRIVVVSGSCSPVTKRQIAWAVKNGFREVDVDVARILSARCDDEIADIVQHTRVLLDRGQSVIVHTHANNSAPAKGTTGATERLESSFSERLGYTLGRILRDVAHSTSVRRAAVVGGDTSGYIARTLGIESLEMAATFQRGAPLCAARSCDPAVDGFEFVFKGGQVGYDDFFGSLLGGRAVCTSIG